MQNSNSVTHEVGTSDTTSSAIYPFGLSNLWVSCQALSDTINIFSVNQYTNKTKAFTNSLSYIGYIALYELLGGSFGRFVLLGMVAHHLYQAYHENDKWQEHLTMAVWNVFLFAGGTELVNLFMLFVGVYRLLISLDVLFPNMGLQEKFNHMKDSLISLIYTQMDWKQNGKNNQNATGETLGQNVSQVSIEDKEAKDSFLETSFKFLEKDLQDKKESCKSFFKAGYALGKSVYDNASKTSPAPASV